MRTRAILLATLVIGATSVAEAQENPGIGGAGPQLERGGAGPGGPPGAGGGDGPGAAMPGGGRGDAERAEPAERPSRAAEQAPQKEKASPARRADREDGDGERAKPSAKKDAKAAKNAEDGDEETKQSPKAAERSDDDKQRRATKEDSGDDGDRKEARTGDGPKAKDGDRKQESAESGDRQPAQTAKKVDLSDEKRGELRNAFRDKGDVKRRTDVDIDISIGRRLPRGWGYAPVPIAVIEIVPEYRGYDYVYIGDEYVICDPDTHEIVAVIPAGGGGVRHAGGGSGPERCSENIRLSNAEEDMILEAARRDDEVEVSDLKVGWSVPGNIDLHRFPDRVLSEASELDACRYFVGEEQLAIVDPENDKVVLVIDKG
jgi:hypothetical protein